MSVKTILILLCCSFIHAGLPGATATTTKKDIIIIGGGQQSGATKSIERYSISERTSQMSKVELLDGQQQHISAWLKDGRILVAGGRQGTGTSEPLKNSEIVDLKAGSTIKGPKMKYRHAWAAAASCKNGDIVVCGGYTSFLKMTLKLCEKYHASRNRFSKLVLRMIERRKELALVSDHDGVRNYFYAIGGTNNDDEAMASVEFHAENHEWKMIAPMKYARKQHAAVLMDGKIYVAGGGPKEAEVYSMKEKKWTMLSSMARERYGLSMVAVDGLIFAIGGYGDESNKSLKSLEIYDPKKSSWEENPDVLVTERGNASAIIV